MTGIRLCMIRHSKPISARPGRDVSPARRRYLQLLMKIDCFERKKKETITIPVYLQFVILLVCVGVCVALRCVVLVERGRFSFCSAINCVLSIRYSDKFM